MKNNDKMDWKPVFKAAETFDHIKIGAKVLDTLQKAEEFRTQNDIYYQNAPKGNDINKAVQYAQHMGGEDSEWNGSCEIF